MPASKMPLTATKRPPKKTPSSDASKSPAELIDQRIGELQDWRGDMLSRLRTVINGAYPDITEEWKWNVPVWSCGGIICTGETYKKVVKLTFAKGASLTNPSHLFNSSLEGGSRRAIDFPEGARIDEAELHALVQAAISLNKSPIRGNGKKAT
jgi:hypothetical protein